MKEIEIDGKQVRVRATPLALLYYKQEFTSDLIGDFMKMEALEADPTTLDSVLVLQAAWAMAKADKPEGFPSFVAWAGNLGGFDFSAVMTTVVDEVLDGFFRGTRGAYTPKK